ncbi:TPA: phage tail protein [Escherichia coli]|nr:phage tail protein [Escherichia coli]HBL0217122.1 phage tail protein [Escherichia coli]HCA2636830.1 phage tail protein [Escherichia coli]
MIYSTGTISINGNTATGSGTNWTAPASQVRAGQTIIVMSNPVQLFQISSVNSATSMTVTPAVSPALSGQKYGILVSDNISVDGLAQAMSQIIKEYDENIGAWETFATTSANQNITVTINGTSLSIPALGKLLQKGSNGALPVNQGGTGAPSAWEATKNLKTLRTMERRFGPGDEPRDGGWSNTIGFVVGQTSTGANGAFVDFTSFDQSARLQIIGFYSDSQNHNGVGYNLWNPNLQTWYPFTTLRDNRNTTVDSNGFIKVASPIVKIFRDGSYETNEESEGIDVTHINTGEYLIAGCTGLNADAAWGGIDGGFEIPVDRNKLARIWLDYEVNADGSVLVKTYHRTHPEAPEFARNEINGLTNGEPVDIPADSFVSVRVEMPPDSIWNQRQNDALEADVQKPTS